MSPAVMVGVLLVAGAVSFAMRVAAITLLPVDALPPRMRRLLDHAAPAAIAALVGSAVAAGSALPDLAARLPVLAGAVVTVAVAWRRPGLVLPVVAGLAVVGLLGLLL